MKDLNLTSQQVRRAVDGDEESIAWIVGRFSPLLYAQARYRMGRHLQSHVDPEDVVNDAWAVALPRLGGIGLRDGRQTPVLMKFLSTTVLHLVNNLLRRQATRAVGGDAEGESSAGGLSEIDAGVAGVVSVVVRQELQTIVLEALDELPETREPARNAAWNRAASQRRGR